MSRNDSVGVPSPASVSSFSLNFVAVLAAIVAIAVSASTRPGDAVFVLVSAGTTLLAVITCGEAVLRRGMPSAASGLATQPLRPVSWTASLERYLGLLVTLAACAAVYWLLPEYHDEFYTPYWRFLRFLAPFVIVLGPLYFRWVAERQVDHQDAYLQLGHFIVTGCRSGVDRDALKLHTTSWVIKAFFLPLMVSYFSQQEEAAVYAWQHLAMDRNSIFAFCFNLTYTIDLLIGVTGYTITMRALDTQIRSTDPSLLGWLVTLVCYRPIYSLLVSSVYLRVNTEAVWDKELGKYPLLADTWFVAIALTLALHVTMMVAIGLRASNLTNRGIVTNGPYRYTKHPGYIAKNVSWWLMFMPFISHTGWTDAVRNSCLLLLTNGVYYLRAKTEEKHLMRDPAYAAYCSWIAAHGVFRPWWRTGNAGSKDAVKRPLIERLPGQAMEGDG